MLFEAVQPVFSSFDRVYGLDDFRLVCVGVFLLLNIIEAIESLHGIEEPALTFALHQSALNLVEILDGLAFEKATFGAADAPLVLRDRNISILLV